MIGAPLPRGELVDARKVGNPQPGNPFVEGRNCWLGSLDPEKICGKVVLCDFFGPFVLAAPGDVSGAYEPAPGDGR